MNIEERQRVGLLLEVARRYWQENQNQEMIGHDLGYSRSQISRMLTEARRRGIVTVHIRHPLERAQELEEALLTEFPLQHAHVAVASDVEDEGPERRVIALAIEVLDDLLQRDSVISVTNGTSVSAVVHAYPKRRLNDATVVQAIGSLARDNHMIDSPEIARTLAVALGARYRLLPAPLYMDNASVAQALRRESSISLTLSMASHADVFLTGIGAVTHAGSAAIFDDLLSREALDEFKAKGAVGHIGGHHIDARGRHVDNELCSQLMGVPFERMREMKDRVAVAWGDHKAVAARAAIRGGLVTHLVTDLSTAKGILNL